MSIYSEDDSTFKQNAEPAARQADSEVLQPCVIDSGAARLLVRRANPASGRVENTPSAFLRRFCGADMIVLMALNDDRRVFVAFGDEATEEAIAAWIARQQTQHLNVYFTPGSVVWQLPTQAPERRLPTKPTKKDIAACGWLWVDIDPGGGETPEQLKIRVSDLATPLRPTVLIDSGNGVQAFWKLSRAVGPDDAERLNAMIARRLGGDHCWNSDRMMRVPGTTNFPNESKRAKGRVKCRSILLHFDDHLFYTVEQIEAAFTAEHLLTGTEAETGWPLRVPDWPGGTEVDTKTFAPWTDDPRLPEWLNADLRSSPKLRRRWRGDTSGLKDPSGSGRDLAVASILHAMRRSETEIAGALDLYNGAAATRRFRSEATKADYIARIFTKLRDRRPAPDADADADDDDDEKRLPAAVVERYNARFAVITVGNSVRILDENAGAGCSFALMRASEFRTLTEADRYGKQSIGALWLKDPRRRTLPGGIVFEPGREVPDAFNLWRGFAVEPDPNASCALFLNHIREVACRGDDALYRWVIGWFADIVQHPDQRPGTAVCLRGPSGAGKTIIGDTVGRLFGPHYFLADDPAHVVGRFNAHHKGLLLLQADEAWFGADPRITGRLKSMITARTIPIEHKGVDLYRLPNNMRLLATTNSDQSVPAMVDERRWAVFDVSDARTGDLSYFQGIVAEMNNGGLGALLHYLQNFDLSTVDVRAIPKTGALAEEKMHNLEPVVAFWLQALREGCIGDWDGGGWPSEIDCEVAYAKFETACRQAGERRPGTRTSFGMRTARLGVYRKKVQITRTTTDEDGEERRKKVWAFEMFSLAEARAAFLRATKLNVAETRFADPDESAPDEIEF